MKVSDIIINIMKIMWRDLKKIRSSSLRQVVRERVSFQDRKNENTPKFPSFEIWY